MLVAKPLADEFIFGHFGRIALLNGFESPKAMYLHLRQTVSTSQSTLCKAVIGLAGLSTGTYLSNHSILPSLTLTRQSKGSSNNLGHGSHMASSICSRLQKYAYFCKECLDHDHESMGFSYWRRAHQLYGIDFCLEHRTPLWLVEDDAAFERPPSGWRHSARIVNQHLAAQHQHPTVVRYAEVLLALISNRRPIQKRIAVEHFRQLALVLRLFPSELPLQQCISNHIAQEFPAAWLDTYWPTSNRQISMNELAKFSKMRNSSIPDVHLYAICLSALFEDTQGSLHNIYKPITRTRINETARRVEYSYFQNLGRSKLINEATGICIRTIKSGLSGLALPSLDGLSDGSARKVLDLLANAPQTTREEWIRQANSSHKRTRWSPTNIALYLETLANTSDSQPTH